MDSWSVVFGRDLFYPVGGGVPSPISAAPLTSDCVRLQRVCQGHITGHRAALQ